MLLWSPLALVSALLLAAHSLRRGSLNESGAAAAFLLGYLTLANNSLVFTVALLVFFFTSSRLTKFKRERKAQLEEHRSGGRGDVRRSKEDDDGGGQAPTLGRNAIQVICNGLTGTLCAVLWQLYCAHEGSHPCLGNGKSRALIYAAIAHYSSCTADTWASELGILSGTKPWMITTMQKTEPGVNGGITRTGLMASVAGGATIGLSSALVLKYECPMTWLQVVGITLLGTVSGTLGSLLDSWLGATCQQTLWNTSTKKVVTGSRGGRKDDNIVVLTGRDILTNDQINFISSATIASLTWTLSRGSRQGAL